MSLSRLPIWPGRQEPSCSEQAPIGNLPSVLSVVLSPLGAARGEPDEWR
jgi:hypothetical protein